MAPIPPQPIPPPPRLRPYRLPSIPATRLAKSVKRLVSLKVVLYVLLGTAAVFSVVLVCWKLGSLVRQFTRGRILQSRKSLKTRYIKTWYGWVPQDRYYSQRQAWKRVLGRPWRWFSWTDSNDDYSWVWWDSSYSKSEKVTQTEPRHNFQKIHRKDEHPGFKLRPSVPTTDDQPTTSKSTSEARPVKFTKRSRFPVLESESLNPSLVAGKHIPDARMSLHYSIYLTYPLHLRPPRSKPGGVRLSEPDTSTQCSRPDVHWVCLASTDPYKVIAWRGCRRVDGKGDEPLSLFKNRRRERYQKKWAVTMQIHGSRNLLPYHGSLHGCPGSPASEFLSRSSDRQSWLSKFTKNEAAFDTTRGKSPYPENFALDLSTSSDWLLVVRDEISLRRGCKTTVASRATHNSLHSRKTTDPVHARFDSLLDGEIWFLDGLDRRLEWLLGECQPGRRGFRFPVLPRNCLTKRPPIIYAYPCCASVELMRLHAASENPIESTRNQSQKRTPMIASQGKPNNTDTSARISSWRAEVNKLRRDRDIEEIKSTGHCGSSAEEPPDNVLDPASWILRRPPQGFPMSTKQKNAYYYCAADKWGKLEDWQMVGN